MGPNDLSKVKAEMHNDVVTDVTRRILSAGTMSGATGPEMLVVLESVIVGVILGLETIMGHPLMIDSVMKAAKLRIADGHRQGFGAGKQ